MEFKFQVNHMFKTAKKSMSNEGILYFIQSLHQLYSCFCDLFNPSQRLAFQLSSFLEALQYYQLIPFCILIYIYLYRRRQDRLETWWTCQKREGVMWVPQMLRSWGGHLQIGCLQIEDFSLMRIQRKLVLTRWAVSLGLPMCYRSGGANVCIHMMVERRNSC